MRILRFEATLGIEKKKIELTDMKLTGEFFFFQNKRTETPFHCSHSQKDGSDFY